MSVGELVVPNEGERTESDTDPMERAEGGTSSEEEEVDVEEGASSEDGGPPPGIGASGSLEELPKALEVPSSPDQEVRIESSSPGGEIMAVAKVAAAEAEATGAVKEKLAIMGDAEETAATVASTVAIGAMPKVAKKEPVKAVAIEKGPSTEGGAETTADKDAGAGAAEAEANAATDLEAKATSKVEVAMALADQAARAARKAAVLEKTTKVVANVEAKAVAKKAVAALIEGSVKADKTEAAKAAKGKAVKAAMEGTAKSDTPP